MAMESSKDNQRQLKRNMKSRHLFMISLGGIIGTGLFLGSGYAIGEAGPTGIILAYLVGGLLMYLAMVCLGELSVVMPVSGSFQAHATKFIGPATGFVVGWVYWLSWALTVGLEFLAAGLLMDRWFPNIPTWIWCLFFVILLATINSLTTKFFAETEYWFAGIKVVAVIVFIIVGLSAIFGLIDLKNQPTPYLSNFFGDGLFPEGISGVFISMMTVVFAFQGSEIMGVAAGETEEPDKSIPRAIRTLVFRILIFYILAIFVLSAILPYKQASVLESPFVTVFDLVGIPYAADIMNFVILTAILSVGNTGLFACTRVMFSLAQSGMAPKVFSKLNKQGVPSNALLITLGFALISLLTSIVAKDTLFVVLLSVSGIGGTLTWLTIAASQIGFRRKYVRNGGKVEDLVYRVKLYPFVPILCIAMCLFIFVFTAYDKTQRNSLFWGLGFIAACYLYYYIVFNRRNIKLPLDTELTVVEEKSREEIIN